MGSIATYIADKAAKKKQTPAEWLDGNLKNFDRYWVSSHIGRYTHPDVAVHLHDDSAPVGEGYLTTADTAVKQDIFVDGGSAFMTIASFLVSRFSQKGTIAEQKADLESKTAWQYFREDSPFIRREIESLGIEYEPLREKVLHIQISKLPEKSDARLKQVYFPIPDRDGEYHLLSILPPSILMLELTNRIRKAFQVQRKCQDKKSECYGDSYQTFPDLTNVRFGGANVQNVSTRNSSLGIQVLPSLPPCLAGRKIKMPKRNFFFDSLYWRSFSNMLLHLDSLFRDQRHNLEMRERREDIILDFVESVLYEANRLQVLPAGWSKETELSDEQAVWLDEAYGSQRQADTDWIWPVCLDFARWLVNAYGRFCRIEKRKEISLSDAELHSFAATMEEVLKQEVREE
ncbi:type I-F CRISPR-associated protein Csy1 [uncultured Mitsuokella sp.]|uniref:type I-F CRISPR-associated protein Csy1 n=1 Tax=uncultured Mitsuokella sp. TaxID=453120 RepID=UPI00259324E9|nr:type I-F CRISPR-associated protein Csy1 [uncultured Mitsuokella sp.]